LSVSPFLDTEGVPKLNVITLSEQIPDEAAAYEYLEDLRWNGTPECPHCGNTERCYFLKARNGARKTSTGAPTQRRLWKCAACRKQFSVLTGTVMHGTKIPVRTWVFVMFEMAASKNGCAAREIERKYGLTTRSAWFMTMRIREAMKAGGITTKMTGTVVADETWVGGKPANLHKHQRHARDHYGPKEHKTPVLSLINKETGEVRSRVIPNVRGTTLKAALADQIDLEHAVLHTDSASGYRGLDKIAAGHESVNHILGEYVRAGVSTNQAENFFSQLKRSLDGTHHHVSREHLNRYLVEFDFRYSTCKINDEQRMAVLAGRVGGRRLTYRPVSETSEGLTAA
jgi:transposase-like protein